MADIEQVLEDFGGNTKKLFKNKWFVIAAVGVAGAGLFVMIRRNRAATEEEATAYEAIGYAGYPTVTGGSDSSYLTGMDSSYLNDLLLELNSASNTNMDSMYLQLSDLSRQVATVTTLNASTTAALEREQAISQMRANSEIYNAITDTATKKALHEENLAIAEKYGWTYDPNTGNYFEGNSVVYTTTRQQVQALTPKTTATSTVTFQNNVDYQAEINKAIMSGASATTINNLNAQRDAKIAATGVTNPNVSYDKNTDYQALINAATAAGASQSVIDNLNAQRNAKIAGENLNPDGSKKS